MASPVLEIVSAQYLGSSAGVLYTSPSGTVTRIDKLTCANASGSPVQVTIYLVPIGGSPDGSNVTTSAKTLTAGQTFNSPNEYGHYLNAGDALYAFASVDASVNILVGGTQVTG